MNKNLDIAILVPSCDRYCSLWKPLIENLCRQWKQCSFKMYIISNHLIFNEKDVTTISIGDDKSWSTNLINSLNFIPNNNIFLLIDDLFISKKINNKEVVDIITTFVKNEWNYIRFNPTPGPKRKNNFNNIGLIHHKDFYRTSTVMSLWKKKFY
jgi:hypothetical protein